VIHKLGEISVMMKGRDRAEILETTRWTVKKFQVSRWEMRRGHRMISETARMVGKKYHIVMRARERR
jgi:hypothetical protein